MKLLLQNNTTTITKLKTDKLETILTKYENLLEYRIR